MKKQDFKVLKTKDLYPFPDNPFHVVEDETLSELAESIKEFGIVTPIITRPKEDPLKIPVPAMFIIGHFPIFKAGVDKCNIIS